MLDAKQQAVQNLYNSLLRTLDDNKKIKLINNSIYLTLINKNLNDVIKFLIESGISKNSNGVCPSSSNSSMLMPLISCLLHQFTISCIASSM